MRISNLSGRKPLRGSRILVALLCLGLLGFHHPALSVARTIQKENKQVIAYASAESVRFASLGELIQMQLEVIASSGEFLFDSGFKSGNVVDWHLLDKQGQRLADGSYLCVVTARGSSEIVTRKRAIASLRDQSISLKQSDSSALTAAQALLNQQQSLVESVKQLVCQSHPNAEICRQ